MPANDLTPPIAPLTAAGDPCAPPAAAIMWDIFCRVVDNFGDIGVTWRLARQLRDTPLPNAMAATLAAATDTPTASSPRSAPVVRLWVDDLASFARICPELDVHLPAQWCDSIWVVHWRDALAWQLVHPARVVIEAFACALPAAFIGQMATPAAGQPTPVWLNLEYLSAEAWVDECHALASPQRVARPHAPAASLTKYFFFPGFTACTGGLLCEPGLLATRRAWQQDSAAQAAFWQRLGLPPAAVNETRISLFSYESATLRAWVRAWRQSPTPVTLLLPQGRAVADVLAGAELPALAPSALVQVDNLTVKLLPMTDQAGYDRLLWSCDLNIVRGEDSFVRAQWAGRPFVWHIYAQDDAAHLDKLNAFFAHYGAALPTALAAWLCRQNIALSQGEEDASLWSQWQQYAPIWAQNAAIWPEKLLKEGDLVTRLMKFLESRL
ncbi:MAG: elongation factor P maturation arginine rhamnosyltransferase EarP [Aeromonas sp.]